MHLPASSGTTNRLAGSLADVNLYMIVESVVAALRLIDGGAHAVHAATTQTIHDVRAEHTALGTDAMHVNYAGERVSRLPEGD